MKKFGTKAVAVFFVTLGFVLIAGLALMIAAKDTADAQEVQNGILESTEPEYTDLFDGVSLKIEDDAILEHFFGELVPESYDRLTVGAQNETDPAEDAAAVQEAAAIPAVAQGALQQINAADPYTYRVTPTVPGAVTFAFAGDILMDAGYANMARMRANGNTIEGVIDETMLTLMRSADVMMVNNEFPFTDRGAPVPNKTFTFHAKTEWVHYLNDMGVDIAGLANNHAYDYGEVGLTDTLDTIRGAGIVTVGAGRNIAEASHPIYITTTDPVSKQPFTISIVAATQIERMPNPSTRGATQTAPGVFRCVEIEPFLEQIRFAKATSDYCIAFVHWGTEKMVESDWAQNAQGPQIAEAGADLIIGAHPHILQKIEYIGDTPVVYSLGNYWFNSSTLNTCLITATITRDGLFDLRFIPAVQKNCTVNYAAGEKGQQIINYMNGLSKNATIAPDGKIAKR